MIDSVMREKCDGEKIAPLIQVFLTDLLYVIA